MFPAKGLRVRLSDRVELLEQRAVNDERIERDLNVIRLQLTLAEGKVAKAVKAGISPQGAVHFTL